MKTYFIIMLAIPLLCFAQKEAFVFTFSETIESLVYRKDKKGKPNKVLPKKWEQKTYEEGKFTHTITPTFWKWQNTNESANKANIYADLKKQECEGTRSVSDDYQCVSRFRWVIGDDVQDILTYDARKATSNYQGKEITAWYAPFIKYPSGTNRIYGLPGSILRLEIIDGERKTTYVAEDMRMEFLQ